jgi:predicted AAA+ superfamily ATPase
LKKFVYSYILALGAQLRNKRQMLKRKIEQLLIDWKNTPDHKPLIVKGCRQCGKTYSVTDFANKNYKNVVYLNFIENPDFASVFSGSLEVDNIVMLLSALLGNRAVFEPGETILILDEIQDCPDARTALKFFRIDGRYDVISTGSLLGVKGYGKRPKSVPVGSETVITMYPLDFEEFLWANGINDSVIQVLKEQLKNELPVPEALHNRMHQLLLQYAVVGGMPDAVQTFVSTSKMNEVLQIQRDIIRSYEDDMIKYATKKDKPLIRECFRSIPKQLSKENKKFQYNLVKKRATAAMFVGSLQWIEDAGMISRCYNLSITELPLDGNAIEDIFKVYMLDCGLFVSMLEDGTQYDILQGNLYSYKGAVYENLIADIFTKMGRKLYYFRKDSGLEIGFVIRYQGECTLVEVKASSGNIKSTKSILNRPDRYHVYSAIKLGNHNIGRNGEILTLPLYMAFLLNAV